MVQLPVYKFVLGQAVCMHQMSDLQVSQYRFKLTEEIDTNDYKTGLTSLGHLKCLSTRATLEPQARVGILRPELQIVADMGFV